MLTILSDPAKAKERFGEVSKKTREKTREELLRFVKENPELSLAELAVLLGISPKGVEWQIKRLKDEARLFRSGGDRGGRWIVQDK